jgi:hypothetical protein
MKPPVRVIGLALEGRLPVTDVGGGVPVDVCPGKRGISGTSVLSAGTAFRARCRNMAPWGIDYPSLIPGDISIIGA